ncbi:hypothetical protein ACFXHA_34220 [Nocardia sp. NPDC059240]|uniref:hypothetical protein n=1 Tax=Nocardia sp. NPDC059240 TaxID=3346786 RepID=UPI00367F7C60
MDGSAAAGAIAIIVTLAPVVLLTIRLVKIKRRGIGGGEFNHPLANAGYGGVAPATTIQQDFGGPGTSQQDIPAAPPNPDPRAG